MASIDLLKLLEKIAADNKLAHAVDTMGLDVKKLSAMDAVPDGDLTLSEFAFAKNGLSLKDIASTTAEYYSVSKRARQIARELIVRERYPNLEGLASREVCQLFTDGLKSPFLSKESEVNMTSAVSFCRGDAFADALELMLKFGQETRLDAARLMWLAPQERLSDLISAGMATDDPNVSRTALYNAPYEPVNSRMSRLRQALLTKDIELIATALLSIVPSLPEKERWPAFQAAKGLGVARTLFNLMSYLSEGEKIAFMDGLEFSSYYGYDQITPGEAFSHVQKIKDADSRFRLYLKLVKASDSFQLVYEVMKDDNLSVVRKEELLGEFFAKGGNVNMRYGPLGDFEKVPETLRGPILSKILDSVGYGLSEDVFRLLPREDMKPIGMKAIYNRQAYLLLSGLPADVRDGLIESIIGNPEKGIPIHPNDSVRYNVWLYVLNLNNVTAYGGLSNCLKRALKDPSPIVRLMAAELIGRVDSKEDKTELYALVRNDEYERIRQTIADAEKQSGSCVSLTW